MILAAVRRAFVAAADGSGHVFPVVLGRGSTEGTGFGAKSGLIAAGSTGAAAGDLGIKVGSYWPANRGIGLAAHGSTTLLLDDTTGFPSALVNAHFLNGMRTAAANAVAVDALAPAAASTLAVFGAGGQAVFEVQAVCQVRPVSAVTIINQSRPSAEAMAAELREWLRGGGADIGLADARASVTVVVPSEQGAGAVSTALAEAELVATVTPNRMDGPDARPLFRASDLRRDAHVSAMGCDGPGKGELPVAELAALGRDVAFFADHPPQSRRVGEMQWLPDAYDGPLTALGDILRGAAATDSGPGVGAARRITVFDSSGIALQDVAAARAVLEAAEAAGLTRVVDF